MVVMPITIAIAAATNSAQFIIIILRMS